MDSSSVVEEVVVAGTVGIGLGIDVSVGDSGADGCNSSGGDVGRPSYRVEVERSAGVTVTSKGLEIKSLVGAGGVGGNGTSETGSDRDNKF